MNAMAEQMTVVVVSLLTLTGITLAQGAAPASRPAATGQPSREAGPGRVDLRFWGHACFTIVADGKTLLIDPHNPKVGYKSFAVQPDLVLISHEHFDHNDTSWLQGKPLILHGLGEGGQVQRIDRRVGPFHVRTVASHHWSDPAQQQRGNNTIWIIEAAGLRIVHLGDLGEKLSDKQLEAIGRPDVLLIPVGGFFTIDADQAYATVQELKPRAYVVPMHYRTAVLDPSLQSRLADPAGFVAKFGQNVLRVDGNELKVDAAERPKEMKVVVMGYAPAEQGR